VTRYVVRRVVGSVPLVLGIATIIFFVVHAAPGDPATTLVRPGLTPAAAAQLRANYGLDDPIPIRYVKWLGSMLTGDFGHSITYGRPTLDVVMDVLPNTLLLSACALFVAFLFGIVLGTIQAVRQYSALDSTLSVVLLFFYSMPANSFVPVPHEIGMIYFGRYYTPSLVALVATATVGPSSQWAPPSIHPRTAAISAALKDGPSLGIRGSSSPAIMR